MLAIVRYGCAKTAARVLNLLLSYLVGALCICFPLSQISFACRYVRNLRSGQHDLQIKIKLCQLVQVKMQRRDDLTFRQEMKFRNKLVEYLTNWTMVNSPADVSPSDGSKTTSRDLDLASMEAVALLLSALPLQPEESDRGDLMEAKSQLFQK